MLSESIIIILIGATSTFLALVVRYGLKSKCSDVDVLCGCLKIHRDIEAEVREELAEMTNHPAGSAENTNTPGSPTSARQLTLQGV